MQNEANETEHSQIKRAETKWGKNNTVQNQSKTIRTTSKSCRANEGNQARSQPNRSKIIKPFKIFKNLKRIRI